jgi:hypothetical protein
MEAVHGPAVRGCTTGPERAANIKVNKWLSMQIINDVLIIGFG